MAEKLKISQRQAQRILNQLQNEKLILKEGSGAKVAYQIKVINGHFSS